MQQAMQRFTALILLLAASTLGLIGCGNKGPLYLPPEVVQEVTSTSSNSAESDEPSQVTGSQDVEEPEAIEPETLDPETIKTGTIEPKTIETGTIEAE
ncbi:MAG: lipoprotein [Porticoccus sp.]|nr:lipoprotein [Porticoccus sp.]